VERIIYGDILLFKQSAPHSCQAVAFLSHFRDQKSYNGEKSRKKNVLHLHSYRMAIIEFWFGNTKSSRRLFLFNFVVHSFLHVEWLLLVEIVELSLSFVEIYNLSVKNEIVDDRLRLRSK
jgi:hypothetical protein